jgi:phage terminase Nu1 subunit (DNA packaging protein)
VTTDNVVSLHPSEWLTRRELAARLQCSVRTLERLEGEGLPNSRWSPRMVRYKLDSVERWLASRRAA